MFSAFQLEKICFDSFEIDLCGKVFIAARLLKARDM